MRIQLIAEQVEGGTFYYIEKDGKYDIGSGSMNYEETEARYLTMVKNPKKLNEPMKTIVLDGTN